MRTKKLLMGMLSFASVFMLNSTFASASGGQVGIPKDLWGALTNFYQEYTIFVYGVVAFGVLSGILAFIILFMQLGATGSNPHARTFIMFELCMVGFCTAMLGGFPIVMEIYFNMFR